MNGTFPVDCVVPADAQLGESPVWDEERQVLWWVDINGRAIHRYDPVAHSDSVTAVPRKPAAVAVRRGRRAGGGHRPRAFTLSIPTRG